MKKILPVKNLTGILFILFICNFVNAQSRDISFTLEDRDRIIQIEEKLNSQQKEIASLRNEMGSLRNEMKSEIASLRNDIDRIFILMYFVLGGLFGLIGLIFWDRRSYIKPIKEDIKDLQNALRDYAKRKPEPELADILRSHGLL
ncbi:MAG: hypothetical protein HY958_01275 [Bacteroidia bacterium]|nr:hypothetical protein [Bacteroidia bacterium]